MIDTRAMISSYQMAQHWRKP